jgi:hypothetical protein
VSQDAILSLKAVFLRLTYPQILPESQKNELTPIIPDTNYPTLTPIIPQKNELTPIIPQKNELTPIILHRKMN